jgi:hypothetical protein
VVCDAAGNGRREGAGVDVYGVCCHEPGDHAVLTGIEHLQHGRDGVARTGTRPLRRQRRAATTCASSPVPSRGRERGRWWAPGRWGSAVANTRHTRTGARSPEWRRVGAHACVLVSVNAACRTDTVWSTTCGRGRRARRRCGRAHPPCRRCALRLLRRCALWCGGVSGRDSPWRPHLHASVTFCRVERPGDMLVLLTAARTRATCCRRSRQTRAAALRGCSRRGRRAEAAARGGRRRRRTRAAGMWRVT